ncbi:MAG TPA: M23 family metallopeptidase [Longimicrobium sp.]|nr:M23 family metallopeptidase [Longimicrobium sp.]
MKTGTVAAFAALLLAAAPAVAQQPADSARMATGRTYARWFYEGRTDTLWARLSPRMRELMPSAAQFAAFRQGVAGHAGAETEIMSESATEGEGGVTVYERVSRFATAPVPLQLTIATTPDGAIAGFGIRPWAPPAESRFMDYATKTALRLPFSGEWYVFCGGRTREQNYHVIAPDQRFAYDFVIRRDGSTHTGGGTRVEEYHCWGRPILAPGAGTVVTAVDSLADNAPGRMDPAHPAGNHVIIDHGNGEFSLLAHLRRGTVAVAAGQRVATGDKLGECGNSGNTSEPHLHYHLQNTAVFGRGEGLPAPFTRYTADGVPVARGEPVRGQTIHP